MTDEEDLLDTPDEEGDPEPGCTCHDIVDLSDGPVYCPIHPDEEDA